MSLWELCALVDGFNASQGGEGSQIEGMSVERLKELNPPTTIH